MPLPERLVQPVNVSRGTLQYAVPDELEGVTNGTLANIIRQLSSLSRHAEEMFGNLFQEAESVAHRSSNLQARIDRIAVKVTQLDSTVEEVSLQDIHLRKTFVSSQSFDQQVVSRETMPKAMLEVYLACDKPPPLDKLNPYREDGKDGLKFYTDPNYFFELWKQEMLKDTERMMHDRGKKFIYLSLANIWPRTFLEQQQQQDSFLRPPGKSSASGSGSGQKADRSKKRVRQPHNTTDRHRQKAVGQGEYIMNDGQHPYDPEQSVDFMTQQQMYDQMLQQQQQQGGARPNSIDLKRQYPPGYQGYNPTQEPIYTPRILRNEQPPSPDHRHSQQQQQYHPHQMQYQQQQQQPPQGYQQEQVIDAYGSYQPAEMQQPQQPQSGGGSAAGTPTRRPNQPPPAPPPGGELMSPGRNSRANSTARDSLPPPPPPPVSDILQQQHQQQLQNGHLNQSPMPSMHQFMNLNSHSTPNKTGHDANDLPPPPPVPATTTSSGIISSVIPTSSTNGNSLGVKVPPEYLPPSPPPPPAPESSPPPLSNGGGGSGSHKSSPVKGVAPPVTSSSGNAAPPLAPPPPPPPPPMNGLILKNGDLNNKSSSPIKTNGSSPSGVVSKSGNSILSPPGLKKPTQPQHLAKQDGVRSDLLKAIRDGIALRKVAAQSEAAKDGDSKDGGSSSGAGAGGQSDVASILARRVAVEMSDSEEGNNPSDSEYDSDDWGDESTA